MGIFGELGGNTLRTSKSKKFKIFKKSSLKRSPIVSQN
jgi:hypothetical protein